MKGPLIRCGRNTVKHRAPCLWGTPERFEKSRCPAFSNFGDTSVKVEGEKIPATRQEDQGNPTAPLSRVRDLSTALHMGRAHSAPETPAHQSCLGSDSTIWPWVKIQIVPPVNILFNPTTKIGSIHLPQNGTIGFDPQPFQKF